MNKDYRWMFHGGNIDGFTAMVFFSPELDLGVVALVNQNDSALPNDIVKDLISVAIKERQPIHDKSFPAIPLNLSFFNPESSLFNLNDKEMSTDKIETFHHPGYGDISLISKNGELFANYYSGIWKITPFVMGDFNYIEDRAGDENSKLHLILKTDFVEVPFEEQVSNIHFAK